MATKYFCDKCGKEAKELYAMFYIDPEEYKHRHLAEICADCIGSLASWVRPSKLPKESVSLTKK